MNNNTKIIIAIIVLASVGALIYFTSRTKPVEQTPTVVVTESALGCYVMHLGKDVYTLVIDTDTGGAVSGKIAFNNFEKDSSSGTFVGTYANGILLGNYSFDSEGSHSDRQLIFKKVGNDFVEGFGPVKIVDEKEVFIDTSKVSYDSKFTFVKSDTCVEHFTDSHNVFSFDYNSFFKAYEPAQILGTDWRQNAKQKGVLLAWVITYKPFMPNTNFSDLRFTVGRSTDAKEIKSCMTDVANGEVKDGSKTIDGYAFTKFTSTGAGAGNLYETTSYRGIVDGDCYALEYTIHSTNIANYSPDQNIKAFDKAKIDIELEKIITSFKFLINSD